MTATCLLVLVLAVCGASAAPCNFGVYNADCDSSPIQGPTTYVQTPVIENPPTCIPSCVPPTSVSKSCHCLRTIVRPQIRNEVITVPTVDRIVRLVSTPVVETVNTCETSRNFDRSTGISGSFVSGRSGFAADVYPEVTLDGCRRTVVGCVSRSRYPSNFCGDVVSVC